MQVTKSGVLALWSTLMFGGSVALFAASGTRYYGAPERFKGYSESVLDDEILSDSQKLQRLLDKLKEVCAPQTRAARAARSGVWAGAGSCYLAQRAPCALRAPRLAHRCRAARVPRRRTRTSLCRPSMQTCRP